MDSISNFIVNNLAVTGVLTMDGVVLGIIYMLILHHRGYSNHPLKSAVYILFALALIPLLNLMIPVHYDYVGTTKVNSNQIAKIVDCGDSEKYTLKNGTSYVVYSRDTSYNYAKQKHTTYTFKRSQAKLSPIRRLFSTKSVPEQVKLTVTKPIK